MGRPAGPVTQWRTRTTCEPRPDRRVDVAFGCLRTESAEPGTLHLLPELVHVEGEPQTPSSRTVTHDYMLLLRRVGPLGQTLFDGFEGEADRVDAVQGVAGVMCSPSKRCPRWESNQSLVYGS